MKDSDLRVGNYYLQYGNYHKVCYEVIERLSKSDINQVWCEPIPLSDEILQKCCFEQIVYKRKGCLEDVYKYVEDGKPCIFVNLNEGVLSVDFYKGLKIKYLHQLQNLYFALTHEELTVNL